MRDERTEVPARILIVEDDAPTRKLLGGAFRALNAETIPAGGVLAAEEASLHQAWNAAVVDLSLPDGSGIDLVRTLRSQSPQSPIVILSSANEFAAKIAALRAGADAYFEKPADYRTVADHVLSLVHGGLGARVLIVEDDPVAAFRLEKLLESANYSAAVCLDARAFETWLREFRPEAIIMDIGLPFASGAELTAFLRQDERYQTIPVIYLTAMDPSADVVIAARTLGDPMLVKPVHNEVLLETLSSRLEHFRRLRSLLEQDALTGLLTRRAFLSRARSARAVLQRDRRRCFSLAMIDIDHFKQINDRYGHPAGDRVLTALADTFRRELRETDFVCRYGGEEFAVMLADADERSALLLLERILANFRLIEHRVTPVTSVSVTFSAGVVALDPDATLEDGIDRADRALYAAKHAGRNRIAAAGLPQPTTTDAVIDAGTIAGLRELSTLSGHDVVRELAEIFQAIAPERVSAIVEAAKRSEGEILSRAAHAFRGAAGNLGLFPLMHACQKLEEIGAEGRWSEAEHAMTHLSDCLAAARAGLQDLIGQAP